MFLGNSFGKNLDILHRTMDASTLRQQVLANNVANADTPNFKRSEVNFEAQLKRALESEKQQPRVAVETTDPRHISNVKSMDYRDVEPRRRLDYLSTSDNNGNNVDIEQESMLLLQNQLRYQLLARSVSGKFSRVKMVLR